MLQCLAMNVLSDWNFEAGITKLTDPQATLWGFRSGERGTHTSRTIMLDELTQLLDAVPEDATREDYTEAVVKHNCLGKRTMANRKLSLQRLSELYALRTSAILFRALRHLWGSNVTSRPLLALLLALARDPLLRASAAAAIRTPYGHELSRQSMKDALAETAADRFNDATLDKVVRTTSSSWTQSGHFEGRGRKTRQKVAATPAATTFALLLGFALGRRGRLLFETPWIAILDAGFTDLIEIAIDAKVLGLLDLKQYGSVLEVSFPALYTDKEWRLMYGTH